ncbi:arylsulfatase B-like isoform X1 [Tigriopus californicus]|uniref:arylsulfatase B-like isoform X1 n=1 Tax=Tigriopus californicus TaxID=6832 RepID=UPI0027DAAFEC|nr:arylsulfatase B-like isoform X1 [Tigriopus californicus]
MMWAQICMLLVAFSWGEATKRPHIIMIVADDLGWNDVGFHGSNQIPTPNIDALAYSGTILHNYYVNPICTPSRSALMTGLHPIHTGLQSGVLVGAAPYALPLSHKLMPEFLASHLGYATHGVGKWHLGSHRAAYTPTKRGFLSHVGYWTGHEDYYDHTAQELYQPVNGWGYDFRRNMSVAWEDFGNYATDIFTNEALDVIHHHNVSQPLFLYLAHLAVHSANTYQPLQAPSEVVEKFSYISDKNRRTFAGMLYKLDESVGRVVKLLQDRQMLQDSIIVFTTDNGGPAGGFDVNWASNWPLRGVKDTLWEGGVRGAGFIWSPLLKMKSRVSNQMMNIQDWLPTLYKGAGGNPNDLPMLDGMNLWDSLSEDSASPRNLMLHNIDDKRSIASLRVAEWKFTRGSSYGGKWDKWFGPTGRTGDYNVSLVQTSEVAQALKSMGSPIPDESTIKALRSQVTFECPKSDDDATCNLAQQVCLFNITADPCERNNLAFKYPSVIKMMEETLNTFNATAIPPGNKPIDPRADPKFFDYTWTNWLDFYDPKTREEVLLEEKEAQKMDESLDWKDIDVQQFIYTLGFNPERKSRVFKDEQVQITQI